MNIYVVTSEPYPEGGAATNRIRSYCKGLSELGNNVQVIVLKPSSEFKNIPKGFIDGYYFIYGSKSTYWKDNSILKKIIEFFWGLINSISIILKEKRNKQKILLLVSNKSIYIFVFFIISKIFKIKYFQEKSEFPFVIYKKKILGKLHAKIYINIIYKFFDGFIVMTKELENFLRKKSRNNAKFMYMPMTVETERFNNVYKKRIIKGSYIAYVGSMGGDKDGVDILIKAFKIVNYNFPNLKLVLIGNAPKHDMNKLISLVSSLHLNNKIIFTGAIARDKIPDYLYYAKVLALARPNNLQSKGGFPTKLGEYLSTGKPIVVTKVGEIQNYLSDGVNAFFAEPNNIEDFAIKMIEVLKNYRKALDVGKRGKEIANEVFNYKIQSKRLNRFLKANL